MGEHGTAVVELAVCLPLLLLTVLMLLTFIAAAGRKIVTERIAAATAVAALNSAGAVSPPAGLTISRRSQRVRLMDAPDGLREAVATMVTAESAGGLLFIREWPLDITVRGSYIILDP